MDEFEKCLAGQITSPTAVSCSRCQAESGGENKGWLCVAFESGQIYILCPACAVVAKHEGALTMAEDN